MNKTLQNSLEISPHQKIKLPALTETAEGQNYTEVRNDKILPSKQLIMY